MVSYVVSVRKCHLWPWSSANIVLLSGVISKTYTYRLRRTEILHFPKEPRIFLWQIFLLLELDAYIANVTRVFVIHYFNLSSFHM